MHPRRLLAIAAVAVTAVTVVTACSSATDGNPTTPSARADASASTPDFPTSSAAASTPDSPTAAGTPTSPSRAPSTPTSSDVTTAPGTPVRTVHVQATGRSYVVKVWFRTSGKDCAAHAYGKPVIRYLGAHPCDGMTRLLATTKVNGRDVGFAEESVTFGGRYPQMYSYAGKFRKLVSKDGTGNVNDLMREGYRLPGGPTSVPYPNAFNAMSQDAVTTVVEAWYLYDPTPDNDPALVQLAKDCFLQV